MEERTNELIQLQSEFIQVFGKEVPSNRMILNGSQVKLRRQKNQKKRILQILMVIQMNRIQTMIQIAIQNLKMDSKKMKTDSTLKKMKNLMKS